MSQKKEGYQDANGGETQVTETQSMSPLDQEVQQVLSKPVRRNYRSLPINKAHENNQIFGVLVGDIFKISDEGGDQKIYVTYPGNPYTTPLLTMSTIKLNNADAGKQVVLSFDQGNPLRPIIMGLLQDPVSTEEEIAIDLGKSLGGQALQAKLDGEQVTLTADKEIVLKCGKSSITLTKAGKIIIRGEYLLSRSTGVNKIKGGSVQIN